MPDKYYSPFQPSTDKRDWQRIGLQAGHTVLERSIVYGFEIIKFVVKFIQDAFKSAIGK